MNNIDGNELDKTLFTYKSDDLSYNESRFEQYQAENKRESKWQDKYSKGARIFIGK